LGGSILVEAGEIKRSEVATRNLIAEHIVSGGKD
jgi:hypothetical protein